MERTQEILIPTKVYDEAFACAKEENITVEQLIERSLLQLISEQ